MTQAIHVGEVIKREGKDCRILSYKTLGFGDYEVELKYPNGEVLIETINADQV
jgi:hypothetical protein